MDIYRINMEIAEELGYELHAFGIFSWVGTRLRDRDFSSIEEAQKYIDSEDERVPESQKAAALGVKIQPCIKSHPNFMSPAVFWPEFLKWCSAVGASYRIDIEIAERCQFVVLKAGVHKRDYHHIDVIEMHTAACYAWLAAMRAMKKPTAHTSKCYCPIENANDCNPGRTCPKCGGAQ